MTDNPKVGLNRLPASERYRRDAAFRTIVDILQSQICEANYTPTELREAVMLAAIMVEQRRPPDPIVLTAEEHEAWKFSR